MSGAAAATVPGTVGEGLRLLLRDLAPKPGRLGDTLRLTGLVLASVSISELFRLPDAAVSAYVVLLVSGSERSSTIRTALVAGMAVILAVLVTILVFMASLSQPALRVPLVALATFAAMFCSRISPLGAAAFTAGFIVAYGLTLGDQIMGLSLQSSEVLDTTEAGLPDLFRVPPEEALVQSLLWLSVVVAMPVALVVAANLLTGRRPAALLRAALGDRLAACADFCDGRPGAAAALAASARGDQRLVALQTRLHAASGPAAGPDYAVAVRETQRLALALLAWPILARHEGRNGQDDPRLRPFGAWCQTTASAFRPGGTVTLEPPAAMPGDDAARPLAVEIDRAAQGISHALAGTATPAVRGDAEPRPGLISSQAVHDPETARYALKVTLAVMLCYAAEELLDWPAIHTCVVTCFFVSLGTLGETLHKATLRIFGALVGGGLGILTILLLMPVMTDLGDLLLALAAVTLLSGWIATGSERISYAGWQIGLAYYLTVLQGYGPTLDMQTARDRVIGIVLGNAIVLLVFTSLWPVRGMAAARRPLAAAVVALAGLMRLERLDAREADRRRRLLQADYGTAMNRVRGLVASSGFEPAPLRRAAGRPLDAGALEALDGILLDMSVILNTRDDPQCKAATSTDRQATLAYHDAVADWLERCAGAVRDAEAVATLAPGMPSPPQAATSGLPARAIWYGVLDRDLRSIVAASAARSHG